MSFFNLTRRKEIQIPYLRMSAPSFSPSHNGRGPCLSFPAEDTVSGLAEDHSEVTSTKVLWRLPRLSGGDRAKQGGGRRSPSDTWLLHIRKTRPWGGRAFWLGLPPIAASFSASTVFFTGFHGRCAGYPAEGAEERANRTAKSPGQHWRARSSLGSPTQLSRRQSHGHGSHAKEARRSGPAGTPPMNGN